MTGEKEIMCDIMGTIKLVGNRICERYKPDRRIQWNQANTGHSEQCNAVVGPQGNQHHHRIAINSGYKKCTTGPDQKKDSYGKIAGRNQIKFSIASKKNGKLDRIDTKTAIPTQNFHLKEGIFHASDHFILKVTGVKPRPFFSAFIFFEMCLYVKSESLKKCYLFQKLI